jgi:hypothetical protein
MHAKSADLARKKLLFAFLITLLPADGFLENYVR